MPIFQPPIGPPRTATGRFWQTFSGASGTLLVTSNRLYATPFVVYSPMPVANFNLEITLAGSSATSGTAGIRFGIYADTGAGLPGNLLIDAGIASSTATATATVTASQILSPGQWWIASVNQGAAVTQPTVRSNGNPVDTSVGTVAFIWTAGHRIENVTGSLPASYGAPAGDIGATPRVLLGT